MYGVLFIAGVLLLELLFVRRLWCRCLCPGGAVYSILGRVRLLRIRRNRSKCIDCLNCDDVCPYHLEPSHAELGGECDNCGQCKAACKSDAIGYTCGKYLREDK